VVKRLLLALLAIACATASATPNEPCEGGEKYAEPRPHASKVKSVEVTRNGLWGDDVSSDETPEDCSHFVLHAGDVREYFRLSRRASFREYVHDLDMSRCHVQGRVRFANGDRGEWEIDRARRGRVRLSDGRALYFFCEACKARAFDEP
jgi:hypothetical protein